MGKETKQTKACHRFVWDFARDRRKDAYKQIGDRWMSRRTSWLECYFPRWAKLHGYGSHETTASTAPSA